MPCSFSILGILKLSPLHHQAMNRAKEYQKLIGYREEDGKIESTDSYLDRIESYMKLYGALVQVVLIACPLFIH